MKSLEILRIDGPDRQRVEDLVTEEVPLRLIVGPRRLATLLCSPADLEDLVRGFFFTAGFIGRGDQVLSVAVNRATWSAFVELAPEIDPEGLRLPGLVGTGCGAVISEEGSGGSESEGPEARGPEAGGPESGGPESGGGGSGEQANDAGSGAAGSASFSAGQLSALMHEALRASEVHRRTGGVHMAALADASGLLLLREDIGRHNAVDKVIGAALATGSAFTDKVLLASGRLSSELLAKALRCGVPVLVSRSAPTDRSVALARERGLTLIGFARGQRLNVYSGEGRLGG